MNVMMRETVGGNTVEYCEVNDVIYFVQVTVLHTHCTDHKYPNTRIFQGMLSSLIVKEGS
jgi:hypothetical protein